ncbi:MAG TPA: ORF6N domain-containing protein [Terriglobales bacterium]|nr:ORF6N domain-containing protein [Terriglobales bacterium]
MQKTKPDSLLPSASIQRKIYFLRDTRVMLDSDLAALYGVSTKNLNRAVKRNRSRFPSDFMFQLKGKELAFLRFQSGTSTLPVHGGRRYLPFVFTEHGVAMLSSVLHSDRAVQVNIAIMRAFVQLRSMLATHEDLRRKIDEMEKRYDSKFQAVFATLRQMLETPIPPKRQIGFHTRPERLHGPKLRYI